MQVEHSIAQRTTLQSARGRNSLEPRGVDLAMLTSTNFPAGVESIARLARKRRSAEIFREHGRPGRHPPRGISDAG